MIKYDNYKESHDKWIGKIPIHWSVERVGKFFTARSEKVDDKSFLPLSVTMQGVVDQLSDVSKTDDGDNRKLVKKNDYVINSRSDRKGSSGIAPRDGSVSLINIVLEPQNIYPEFVQHLFKSYFFKEEFFRNGKGIHWDLWTTRWDQLKKIYIPLPPKDEQEKISKYLTKKNKEIDLLIAKINSKIDLLNENRKSIINHYVTKGLNKDIKLKSSGLDTVGKIPIHWEIKKISNLFYQSSVRGNEKEMNLSVFRDYGVVKRDDYKNKNVLSEDLSNYKLVNKGDIVLNKMKTWMGSLGVSDYRGIVSPAYYVLRPNFNFFSGYIHHLLRSQFYIDQYASLSKGIRPGQWDLNIDDFKSLRIFIPPVDEQKKISYTISKKLDENLILLNIEKERSKKIIEYWETLVSSAVLGRFKI